jgi:hypothetical protein
MAFDKIFTLYAGASYGAPGAFQVRDLDAIEDFREEFAERQYWVNLEQLERRAVKQQIQQYAVGDEPWQWQ